MAEAEENCEYPHRFKIKYFKLEDGFEPLWCNFAVSKESEEIARYNVAEITGMVLYFYHHRTLLMFFIVASTRDKP